MIKNLTSLLEELLYKSEKKPQTLTLIYDGKSYEMRFIQGSIRVRDGQELFEIPDYMKQNWWY